MLSGSAGNGAAIMLAFGAGTLPMLLGMGMLGSRLHHLARSSRVRMASGLLVLAFGVLGLARAVHGVPSSWLDTICITPAVSTGHVGHVGGWK
jgi:sulfite exporter TauE/SafE